MPVKSLRSEALSSVRSLVFALLDTFNCSKRGQDVLEQKNKASLFTNSNIKNLPLVLGTLLPFVGFLFLTIEDAEGGDVLRKFHLAPDVLKFVKRCFGDFDALSNNE